MNEKKLDWLNSLIADVYEVDKSILNPDTSFLEELNADSLKRTVLSAEIEEETGVYVSVAQLLYMEKLADLYKELGEWLNEK